MRNRNRSECGGKCRLSGGGRHKPHDHLPSIFTPRVAQGWATRQLGHFRETGQVPGKTRQCYKCKVTLLFLYFFRKNKIMCFLIMQNRKINYLTEYKITNLAVKPSWAPGQPFGQRYFSPGVTV